MLANIFESAKSKADSMIPGGIATIERMKGDSINNFSGYNSLLKQINQVRDQSIGTIHNKKQQVSSDL